MHSNFSERQIIMYACHCKLREIKHKCKQVLIVNSLCLEV